MTLSTFAELDIKYVEKDANPPNIPQLRPIEDFWGMLKDLVYKGDWRADNHAQLKARIRYCLQKIDQDIIISMMSKIHLNVRRSSKERIKSNLH